MTVAFKLASLIIVVSADECDDAEDGTAFKREVTAAGLIFELVFESIIKFRIICMSMSHVILILEVISSIFYLILS